MTNYTERSLRIEPSGLLYNCHDNHARLYNGWMGPWRIDNHVIHTQNQSHITDNITVVIIHK